MKQIGILYSVLGHCEAIWRVGVCGKAHLCRFAVFRAVGQSNADRTSACHRSALKPSPTPPQITSPLVEHITLHWASEALVRMRRVERVLLPPGAYCPNRVSPS